MSRGRESPTRTAGLGTALLITLGLAFATGPTAADASIRLKVDGLEPRFKPSIRDYTVSCTEPVVLRVRTPGPTKARVGGARWFDGSGRRAVRLSEGQAIKVLARTAKRKRAFWVRCLPENFPAYEYRRFGKVASRFYVVTPASALDSRYVAIMDRRGVPIWWYQAEVAPFDAKVLGGDTVVWTQFAHSAFSVDPASSYEFHALDGRLLNELRTVGAVTDQHDLQRTRDGNYLLLGYVERAEPLDLGPYVGDADGHVYDGVVQELTPEGQLVWQWSTEERVDPAETGQHWWEVVHAPPFGEPYDYAHINAVEELPDGDLLISLRHTDAIYRIDAVTGDVEWKLGGTPTAASLKVKGDPLGDYPFGGQHDVRYLVGGRISVYDNGTELDRPPRAVIYRIEDGTAILLDSVTDPEVPVSDCCGSARYVDGSWLVSWGGTRLITEIGESGAKTFKLEFEAKFSYRAVPVGEGLSGARLRAGMNAQIPAKR